MKLLMSLSLNCLCFITVVEKPLVGRMYHMDIPTSSDVCTQHVFACIKKDFSFVKPSQDF